MSFFVAFRHKVADLFQEKPAVLTVVLLAFVTLFTYGNSAFNGFVWDDHDIIVNNAANRDPANFFAFFSSPDSTISGNQKAYYRPLNRLTYMLDYQLFGLRPAGYHVENIIIHFMVVVLFYLAARKLFAKNAPAFIAALIFAVHPVNAEAVNFISTRNSLLAALFVLLAVMAYFHAETVNRRPYHYLSGLFFFLGLLCKEQALMLPAVLLLYAMTDYSAFRERIREKLLSMLPFGAAIAIYLVLRAHALSSVFGLHPIGQGLWDRLLQNAYIIPQYAAIILFPMRLNAYYMLPQDYLAEAAWIIPLWIVLIAAFLVMNKKSPATKFGLLWFAINYIPISNIVPIPSAPMAERYLYLPAIGLWLVAADQAYGLYVRSVNRRTLMAAGVAAVFCLAVITVNRNFDWKDNLSFYARMVERNPDSALAHFSLGLAYREKADIPRAQAEWKRTAEIDPAYFNVLGHLGESYLMTNSLEEAEYYYAKEVEINPGDMNAVYNLALLKEKLGKPREALHYYEQFLDMQPHAYSNLIPKVRVKIELLRKSEGMK